MIVATRPLIDCCPIVPAAMEGRQIVQWDKDSCSDAGFLKIDLLGLGMLSAVERCVEMIARTRGERIDLSPDPLRRSGHLRVHPERRHDRGLPDREPRADAVAAPHPPREPPGHHDPGRDRPARADPGRRRQPLHRAPPAAARGPRLRGPLRAPLARAGAARDARDDHLPGPGARGRDRVRRLLGRRGRGAAAGDEPQALGGGDRGLPQALRRGRAAASTGSTRRPPSACSGRWSRASPASASRRRTAPPSGCSPTSRRGCASTTAPSSCARCSTSSRWASTRPTRSSTRRSGGGSRCWRRTSTRARSSARSTDGARSGSASATSAASASRRSRSSSPPARRGGRFRSLVRARLARGRRRVLAGAAGVVGGVRLAASDGPDSAARRRCGSSGSPRPGATSRAAPSWRSRSTCPRRRSCGRCRSGSRCSPTTPRPG